MRKTYTDQIGHSFTIDHSPIRIVSLVPSQTELLVDLGLEEYLVGITKFCIHPKQLKSNKVIIGGTKNFHFDKIEELKPDIIIANKEENFKEGIEKLQGQYPVWTSNIKNIEDVYLMNSQLGDIFNVGSRSEELNKAIRGLVEQLKVKNQSKGVTKTAYLIWNNPIMVAGTDNFINEILLLENKRNVFNTKSYSRYPETSLEEIKKLNPDMIYLSSEPYPFKEKHLEFFKKELPQTTTKLVDGEIYSWYGSRLIPSLKTLLNE